MLKKNKTGGLTLPDFKTYYKTRVIKMVISVKDQTNRSMEQKNLETDPCKYSQLIVDKGENAIQWSKDGLFKKWC